MADFHTDQLGIPNEEEEPCRKCHGVGKGCRYCDGSGYDPGDDPLPFPLIVSDSELLPKEEQT